MRTVLPLNASSLSGDYLQLLHLLLQGPGLLALVGKRRQPVVSEDHAVTHHDGERAGRRGRGPAAVLVQPPPRGGHRTADYGHLRVFPLVAQPPTPRRELSPVSLICV